MAEDKDRVEGAAKRKHVQAKLRTITGLKRTVPLPPTATPRIPSERKRIITLNFPPKKQRKRKRSERILIF